jgi:hypothetical protein
MTRHNTHAPLSPSASLACNPFFLRSLACNPFAGRTVVYNTGPTLPCGAALPPLSFIKLNFSLLFTPCIANCVSRDGSAGATGWGWDERRRAQIARGAWCADPARAEDCSRLLPSGSAIGLGYHHDRVNTGGNKAFFCVCVCGGGTDAARLRLCGNTSCGRRATRI